MKTIVMTIAIGTLFTLVGAVAFMVSGLYDVSASTPHSAVSNWAMATTMHASVKRRARHVEVPDLSDETLALAGVNDFEATCVACHGAPGKEPAPVGQGLNPPAPDLSKSADHMTAAELFWVTKHGIRMTGMPAWGATHHDDTIWAVVALMTALPDLDASAYEELLARAEGLGHHAKNTCDNARGSEAEQNDAYEHKVPARLDQPPEHDHSTGEH